MAYCSSLHFINQGVIETQNYTNQLTCNTELPQSTDKIGNTPFTVQCHMQSLAYTSHLEQIRPTQTAALMKSQYSCYTMVQKIFFVEIITFMRASKQTNNAMKSFLVRTKKSFSGIFHNLYFYIFKCCVFMSPVSLVFPIIVFSILRNFLKKVASV